MNYIKVCFFFSSENKRPLTEPPIPGYRGYIPRIKTTEQGLGCRYNQTTKKGLEMFAQETARHARFAGSEIPQALKRLGTYIFISPGSEIPQALKRLEKTLIYSYLQDQKFHKL